MIENEEKEEMRINLIGMMLISCLFTLGSIFLQPNLDIEFATIDKEPVFVKVSKSNRYEFSTKEQPSVTYKIRYIYDYLYRIQKQAIEHQLKKGVPIEVHVDNDRMTYNEKEVYVIKANDEIIFGIEDYESLRFRENVMWIGFVMLAFISFVFFESGKYKDIGCLIWFLLTVGLLILVLFFFVRRAI